MGRFLNTRGRATLAIGVCGRCATKFPLGELMADANSPGLLVCRKDRDQLDPYRLAPRPTERLSLPFVRPDDGVVTNPSGVISEDGDLFLITEDGEEYLLP